MPLAAFPKCFLDDLCVTKSMTVEEWIDLAADQLDIDGLEFYWGFTPADDPKRLYALSHQLQERNLAMPMMCCSPDFTHPDLAFRQAEIEKQKHAIRTTASLGGRYCRTLSGQRRPDVSRAQGLDDASNSITELIPYAEEHGITLILENHYKDGYWDFPEFAQKLDVFVELLDRIPESPWFGVNYDPSNAIIAGDDPIEVLQAVKHRVVTMHASDRYFEGGTLEDLHREEAHPAQGYASFLKHGVIGRGMNDFDVIFGILTEVGFQGWISIEDGQDPEVGMDHLRESAVFLRAKMAEHGLK